MFDAVVDADFIDVVLEFKMSIEEAKAYLTSQSIPQLFEVCYMRVFMAYRSSTVH